MYLVLITKINIAFKIADLDKGAGDEFFWIRVKQKHCSPLEIVTFAQMQFIDQLRIGFPQYLTGQAIASQCLFAEPVQA